MFRVQNGVFGYEREDRILNGIDFSLAEGKILTILGPNGAGKTTLLKCMVGLLKWQDGRSLLEDRPVPQIPAAEFWKKVSYVPQAKNFAVPYSVREMVVMGRAPYIGVFSVPGKMDYEIATETMASLGILHLQNKQCSRISGGELQLALIARALVAGPKLVILDEPESHLDFRNQLLVLEKLQWVATEKGISCVINTHYPENAFRISDRTLMLGRGKRYVFGETREVITEENLREFFGVRVRILPFREGERDFNTIFPVELANTAFL
ncbi:iron complex transport system ATP-binding protein [Hydrogenispora ethanolica]|jgi:iron complex transport system ATP-binding protein|uniref:Iron complex transport system ATP-binding protein n=1 Tax=Hydrogenispora ethanolica TaxID=1082276 RepID=A0A4R1R5W8_HYDET|nr:ABC transporter ATP-binding protein [Hydrogenispora ethanolica]TCL60878.1 iron complex transport system ATP-binding protein [Hydrogenispora ethanolica]